MDREWRCIVLANATRQLRKKRVPKLAHTEDRGIGWHVSYRDPATGLPRKHRFGRVPEDRARILYHQWVSQHLDGKPLEAAKPGPKLQPLTPPSHATALVVNDMTVGSLLHIATDLLNFDESRTRKDGSARTRGTIHSRVRLNGKEGIAADRHH